MTFEFIVITLLAFIIIVLITLFISSSKKDQIQEIQDFEKIEKQLNTLLHKTIEQSGYVNSKIDEIGDLTKKMTNAMNRMVEDKGLYNKLSANAKNSVAHLSMDKIAAEWQSLIEEI